MDADQGGDANVPAAFFPGFPDCGLDQAFAGFQMAGGLVQDQSLSGIGRVDSRRRDCPPTGTPSIIDMFFDAQEPPVTDSDDRDGDILCEARSAAASRHSKIVGVAGEFDFLVVCNRAGDPDRLTQLCSVDAVGQLDHVIQVVAGDFPGPDLLGAAFTQ